METVKRKRGNQGTIKRHTLVRMQAILDFVRAYYAREGIPPTLKEITVGIGRPESDFPNVSNLIKRLIEAGFLYRAGNGNSSMRCLMLVDKPPRKQFYKEVDRD